MVLISVYQRKTCPEVQAEGSEDKKVLRLPYAVSGLILISCNRRKISALFSNDIASARASGRTPAASNTALIFSGMNRGFRCLTRVFRFIPKASFRQQMNSFVRTSKSLTGGTTVCV